MLRLWLDDIRPMPADFDYHIKTAEDAIRLLSIGNIGFISFDHDLGDENPENTGYAVAKYIEKACHTGEMICPRWAIHSANPVGRANIQRAMESAKNASDQRDRSGTEPKDTK